MKELAKEVNDTPLPNIPDSNHILLPPPEFSLLKNNFQIYSEEISNKFIVNSQTGQSQNIIGNINKESDSNKNINDDNKMIIDDDLQIKKKESNNKAKKVLGKKKNRTQSQSQNTNKIEIKLDDSLKINFTKGLDNDEEENFD